MFKILKENKIIGVSEESPVLLDKYEIEQDEEHTVADYTQVNGEYVLTSSAEAIEQRKETVRSIRNQYLAETDKYMISDYPITEEQREEYKAYRQYLRDYTKTDSWYEHNPLTFDEWKAEQVEEVEPTPDDSTELEPDNQIESSSEPETTQSVQESLDDSSELEADMDAILGTKMQ